MSKINMNNFSQTDSYSDEPDDEEDQPGFVDKLSKAEQIHLKKKILNGIQDGIKKNELKKKIKKIRQAAVVVAASVACILLADIFIWQTITAQNHVVSTKSNEKETVQLPDGTNVMLNSNSVLTYSTDIFGDFSRKVHLEGEAYFEVSKTENQQRFIINQGEALEVVVFGTAFSVKDKYPVHKLTLLEGKVQLGYKTEAGVHHQQVLPGQSIRYDPLKQETSANTDHDPLKLLAWKEGKLEMKEESLTGALDILSELYDLQIAMDSVPTTRQVSGTLPLADNPHEVLKNVSILFDIEIQLKQSKITTN